MSFEVVVSDDQQTETEGVSFFGHDEKLKGLILKAGALPAQLLLTIHQSDPMFSALQVRTGKKIRLVYPFYHSYNADIFSYRHLDDDTIKFETFDVSLLDVTEDIGWPSPGFPRSFPRRKIRSRALQGAPAQDATAIFVGSQIETMQQHEISCPDCNGANVRLLAKVPGRPIEAIEIWDGNDSVNVLFWSCDDCGSIITHNESD